MNGEWMTEEEAAGWIDVPMKELREAVSRGELPVLRIRGQVRLSRTALIAHAGATQTEGSAVAFPTVQSPATRERRGAGSGRTAVPAPAGFTWRQALTAAEPFDHHWPARGGSSIEKYPRAWAGTVAFGGADVKVLVGEATGAERNDGKRRLTVLLDGYPMTEFAPTADGKGWASLIKPDGRHSVAPSGPLPRLYREVEVAPYHQATGLRGRGRPSGAAVVIASDDYVSAVHHAAARWLAKKGHPVEPAA